MQAGAGSDGEQARTPRKTSVSGGAARQPSVYAGFRIAYPPAPYLRGFPAGLPANARLTRAVEAARLKRPKDAGFRLADLANSSQLRITAGTRG